MILIRGKEGLIHRTGKEIQNVFQNLFKQRGKWRRQAAQLAPYYTEAAPCAKNTRKQIISMIDGRMHHGGLADRLRGIVSAYYVSKEMGLDFKIHFVHPFRLDDYLVPNKVDWKINDDDICYNSKCAVPMFCGSNATLVEPFFQKLWFKKKYKEPVSQVHVYTNAMLLPRGCRFRDCFNELFKPSAALEKALSCHAEALKDGYYVMTFRFQQLLGDFKEEQQFTILPPDEQQLLMERCVSQIEKLYAKLEKKRVVLTSDSRKFLDFAKERLDYVYVVPGIVAHMDWSTDIPFDVNLKSFVDFYMISRAEKAFLLQTGKMYNSGFPRRAAQVGNVPFKHIRF